MELSQALKDVRGRNSTKKARAKKYLKRCQGGYYSCFGDYEKKICETDSQECKVCKVVTKKGGRRK